jgi:hypothetical protein
MSAQKRTETRSIASLILGFVAAFLLVDFVLPEHRGSAPAGFAPSPESSTSADVPDPLPRPDLPATSTDPAPVSSAPSPPPKPEQRVESPPPTGVVIYGVVSDITGELLAGAGVWVTRDDGNRVHAKADDRGRYSLPPLPFGSRRVDCGERDYHREHAELTLTPERPLLRQDFQLRPQQVIRVRLVTSDGSPALPMLAKEKVSIWSLKLVPVATREDPGDTFEGVTGSLNNTFGIGGFRQSGMMGKPDLGPEYYGTVTLHEYEEGPAWLSLVAAHQVLRKQPIDPSVEEVTFVIGPEDFRELQCEVGATIVAIEDGVPLAGQAWLEDDPFPMRKPVSVGDDGRVHFQGVLPGKRWLIVAAPERARVEREVNVARGETLELGDIPLSPPIELRGRVHDEEGNAIEAVLRWGRLDPADVAVDWVRQRSLQSEPDGSFAITGLEPGIWVVHSQGLPARGARSHDPSLASLPVRANALAGSVEGIEIVVHPTIAITLVAEDLADPWPYVRAYDTSGLPASAAWVGRWGAEIPMHLVPGEYELVLKRDSEELQRGPLIVGEKPLRLEFSFDSEGGGWEEK